MFSRWAQCASRRRWAPSGVSAPGAPAPAGAAPSHTPPLPGAFRNVPLSSLPPRPTSASVGRPCPSASHGSRQETTRSPERPPAGAWGLRGCSGLPASPPPSPPAAEPGCLDGRARVEPQAGAGCEGRPCRSADQGSGTAGSLPSLQSCLWQSVPMSRFMLSFCCFQSN